MKQSSRILLIYLLTFVLFQSCSSPKKQEETKEQVNVVKQIVQTYQNNILNEKVIGADFLKTFDVESQEELKQLTISDPVPMIILNNSILKDEKTFLIALNNPKPSYYTAYFQKNNIPKCQAIIDSDLSELDLSKIIVMNCGSEINPANLKTENYRLYDGRVVPVGVETIVFFLSDLSQRNLTIIKHEGKLFGKANNDIAGLKPDVFYPSETIRSTLLMNSSKE